MFLNLDIRKGISLSIIAAFLMNVSGPLPEAKADDFHLPAPGVIVRLSPPLNPPILKGIKVHPDNPLKFDFILDAGDQGASSIAQQSLKEESTTLIKYFLASLTIPEKDLWVNLSPYEKNRIVPASFGQTEMGRDLLAEDYMLKQITASIIYPEDAIGKKFWKRIYQEAAKKFGTTDIPVSTFNKVWIIPDKAVVYENAKTGTAYIVKSKLKVMLEQDYLAFERNQRQPGDMASAVSPSTMPSELGLNAKAPQGNPFTPNKEINALGSQVVREVVIPELAREINEDKNFSQLRQAYNSLILATWYKKKIKDSILEQVYADKNKIAGVGYEQSVIPALRTRGHVQIRITKNVSPSTLPNEIGLNVKATQRNVPNDVEIIYQRYLQAFKKGAYNYIKEEVDPVSQQTVPRKYFSGGENFTNMGMDEAMTVVDTFQIPSAEEGQFLLQSRFDVASMPSTNPARMALGSEWVQNFLRKNMIISPDGKGGSTVEIILPQGTSPESYTPLLEYGVTTGAISTPAVTDGIITLDTALSPARLHDAAMLGSFFRNWLAKLFGGLFVVEGGKAIYHVPDVVDFINKASNPTMMNDNIVWGTMIILIGVGMIAMASSKIASETIAESTARRLTSYTNVLLANVSQFADSHRYSETTRNILKDNNLYNIPLHSFINEQTERSMSALMGKKQLDEIKNSLAIYNLELGMSWDQARQALEDLANEDTYDFAMNISPFTLLASRLLASKWPQTKEALGVAQDWVITHYYQSSFITLYTLAYLLYYWSRHSFTGIRFTSTMHTVPQRLEKYLSTKSSKELEEYYLKHPDDYVREAATKVFGHKRKDIRTANVLLGMLKDPSIHVRKNAAEALTTYHLTIPQMLEVEMEMLKIGDMVFQENAMDWMSSSAGQFTAEERQQAIDALLPMFKSTIRELRNKTELTLTLLNATHDDMLGGRTAVLTTFNYSYVTLEALDKLKEMGDFKAVRPILDGLKHSDLEVRKRSLAVAESLLAQANVPNKEELFKEELFQGYIRALDSMSLDALQEAADFLGNTGDPEAAQPLLRAFYRSTASPVDQYRLPSLKSILDALIKLRVKEAIVPIARTLQEKWVGVNNYELLLNTLEQLATPTQVYQAHVDALKSSSRYVRQQSRKYVRDEAMASPGPTGKRLTALDRLKIELNNKRILLAESLYAPEQGRLRYQMSIIQKRIADLEKSPDNAQLSKGGIDFNANKINLQLQNGGQEIKFHIDPAMLRQLQNAPGLTPVIINIQPMTDLRTFLGLP